MSPLEEVRIIDLTRVLAGPVAMVRGLAQFPNELYPQTGGMDLGDGQAALGPGFRTLEEDAPAVGPAPRLGGQPQAVLATTGQR